VRVSTDERDSGYAKWREWGGYKWRWRVFLDGVEVQKGCVTADEETGEIRAAVLNARGGYQIAPSGDAVWEEWRRGVVRIVIQDRQTGAVLYGSLP